ncbi:hypothetical protein PR202_gb15776 [Eleusine coracana subsp. coracana]|uniref:Uncharacterized protein n=1 Tax=Eleusine coracana subsp. coracana TaxID=191504 RepID=A0AAV5EZU9_ELECO|nr:hypothetical protein PR202_gb15776 [Eleusine coracana subsp. coracana]
MIRMAPACSAPAAVVGLRGGAAASKFSTALLRGSRTGVAASIWKGRRRGRCAVTCCSSEDSEGPRAAAAPSDGSIQLYSQIERVITEAAKQSREGWGSTGDWTEIEVNDLPTFGIGHSLGSVVHLLIGSRYAVQRSGNILMAFNNKAEAAIKQLENLSPPVVKQLLPLIQQLPPLYMDLVNGREDFIPKPEETRRLIKSYYGISRNLLIKFKDDQIDETSILAQVLSSESAISSQLDMSIRSLPGDHGLPLQQVLPDVPSAMADAVNRGGELLANLTTGTPWEAVAKEA